MKPLATMQSTVDATPGVGKSYRPTASARARAGTLAELVQLLRQNGRFWLVPMLAILALAGVLLLLVQAVEYVAPFVYTVF